MDKSSIQLALSSFSMNEKIFDKIAQGGCENFITKEVCKFLNNQVRNHKDQYTIKDLGLRCDLAEFNDVQKINENVTKTNEFKMYSPSLSNRGDSNSMKDLSEYIIQSMSGPLIDIFKQIIYKTYCQNLHIIGTVQCQVEVAYCDESTPDIPSLTKDSFVRKYCLGGSGFNDNLYAVKNQHRILWWMHFSKFLLGQDMKYGNSLGYVESGSNIYLFILHGLIQDYHLCNLGEGNFIQSDFFLEHKESELPLNELKLKVESWLAEQWDNFYTHEESKLMEVMV